jgi:hypothetical protein
MTAEVVVMNRQALALAADSAITVRTGQGSAKAWPTASKIFAMSRPHSVAFMIYGSTSLHRLPWDTIIKDFATSLRSRPYKNLTDYTTSFLRFLRARKELYPSDEQDVFVYAKLVVEYLDLRLEIEGAIHEALEGSSKDKLTPAEQRDVISDVLGRWGKRLRDRPRLVRLPTGFRQQFSRTYGKYIRQAKAEVFQQMPLTQGQSRQLTTIGHLMFERDWLWESHSGIVVAGYGADDLFPSYEEVTLEGFAVDFLIMHRRSIMKVRRDMGASVRAFAQSADVSAFMEGVIPGYQEVIERKLHEKVVDLPLELLERLNLAQKDKTKARRDLLKFTHDVFRQTLLDLNAYRRDRFVDPVLAVVAALPIEDLAIMAETLVNLTSFRQKVSMSVETVGGPVDVAVISRGDGFIWIKRKNYFQLDQNPRVLAKYFVT